MKKQGFMLTIVLIVVLASVLTACGAATPERIVETVVVEQKVVETVVVEKDGETIVETVEVEKEVVVTATPEPMEAAYDENAPIEVWVDATREEALDLWKEQNPDKADLVNVSVVDRAQFHTQVLLMNNVGEGWPDVVFLEPQRMRMVADAAHDFPADLTDWVPQEIIDNFGDTMEECYLDGKMLCLRNDVAQIVMFYNAPLMAELGYEVPETWEDFIDLSLQVKQDHPDKEYYLGTCGEGMCWNAYFMASECPALQELSTSEVRINPTHPNCTRVAEMVDTLVANGTMHTIPDRSDEFVELIRNDQVLMWPGASWFVHYVFPTTYYPEVEGNEGKVGVAMLPHWEDQETPFTGKRGGSAWVMSKHTQNPQLSSELITWLTTSEYQESVAGGFPAYGPAAEVWCENKPAGPLFANDPCPVLRETAGLVWPGMDLARVSLWEPFQTAVINPVIDGGSAVESLPVLGETLVPLAEEVGYQIITNGP